LLSSGFISADGFLVSSGLSLLPILPQILAKNPGFFSVFLLAFSSLSFLSLARFSSSCCLSF
jgi:hypothetical protein